MCYGAYWPDSLNQDNAHSADNPELLHVDDVAELRRQVARLTEECRRLRDIITNHHPTCPFCDLKMDWTNSRGGWCCPECGALLRGTEVDHEPTST